MKPTIIRRLLSAGLFLAAASCTAEVATDPAPEAGDGSAVSVSEGADNEAVGCAVSAVHPWIDEETPIRRYTAEAHTFGPTCEQAIAVLVIRAREGSPLYTWSGRVQDIFGLKDAGDAAAMTTALDDWIANSGGIAKTSELPAWETTDGQPQRAEFPFMPESWIDKAYWDTLKADNLDMFCFPQGGESLNCAALRGGQMEEIGLQLFPG